jgi:hypothetical protein
VRLAAVADVGVVAVLTASRPLERPLVRTVNPPRVTPAMPARVYRTAADAAADAGRRQVAVPSCDHQQVAQFGRGSRLAAAAARDVCRGGPELDPDSFPEVDAASPSGSAPTDPSTQ